MFFLEKVLRNVRIRLDSDLHPCYSDVESRSIRCNRCSMLPTTAFSSSGATKIKTNVILELSTGTMDILDALPLVLPHLQELAHLDTASWSTQSAQLITVPVLRIKKFGSGFRILTQFVNGSGSRVMISILNLKKALEERYLI